MNKILVRGGADPLKHYTPRELLIKDSLGGNSGNLMFLYGTMSILTTSKTTCSSTYYKTDWTTAEIDEINQTCSAYVLPLADGFRSGFVEELNKNINLIKQLKIPCIVNGVGLRANYEPSLDFSYPFNDIVKAFVREVLNHSAMLGLRGEITGEYLKSLGFIPERDYTVIGCPSMYMHGILQENLHPKDIAIAMSLNGLCPPSIEKFYTELIQSTNVYIIQQRTVELIDLYYGRHLDLSTKSPEFPRHNIFESFDYNSAKKTGHVLFFTDVPNWIEYLKNFPLFVGARFHGTVAALLAGVPAIITPFDSRTRELSAYHHIPTISMDELKTKHTIESLQEIANYGQIAKSHLNNLVHYKDFLKLNGLYSIFDEYNPLSFIKSPFENQALNSLTHTYHPLSAYDSCCISERAARIMDFVLAKGKRRIMRLMNVRRRF